MTAFVVDTPYGPAAIDALDTIVRSCQADDPFAAVTVLCPSIPSGLVARRTMLTRRNGVGLANVGFMSINRLGELIAGASLAAQGRSPASRQAIRAAIRAQLAADPGGFAECARHPSTELALARTFDEFNRMSDAEARAFADRGTVAASSVALCKAVRHRLRRCQAGLPDSSESGATQVDGAPGASAVASGGFPEESAGLYTSEELLTEASRLVTLDPLTVRPFGHIVWYLPEPADRVRTALLTTLARVTSLHVVKGVTGVGEADRGVTRTVDRVAGGAFVDGDTGAPGAVSIGESGGQGRQFDPRGAVLQAHLFEVHLRGVPDPEAEVRAGLRLLLGARDEGHRWESMSLVFTNSSYEPIVREVLAGSNIPWWGLPGVSVANSDEGVLFAAVSRVLRGDWSREALAELFIRPGLTFNGAPVPGDGWDQLSRQAGIVGGASQWLVRLGRYRDRLARDVDASVGDGQSAGQPWVDMCDELIRFVGWIVELQGELGKAKRWDAWATTFSEAFQTLIGVAEDPSRFARSADEIALGMGIIDEVLTSLAQLDALEPFVSNDRALQAALTECEQRRLPARPACDGLFVGVIDSTVGHTYERTVLIGAAEGDYPRADRPDPLLQSHISEGAAGLEREATEHRDLRLLLQLLASSAATTVMWPRGDQRRGRDRTVSRWFGPSAAPRGEVSANQDHAYVGTSPGSQPDHLPILVVSDRIDASTFQSLGIGPVPLTIDEWETLGVGMAGCTTRGDVARLAATPEVLSSSILRRGVERAFLLDGAWSRFDGDARAHPPSGALDDILSASRIETFLKCPRLWMLRYALGVSEVVLPEMVETIDPRTRGSLIHEILETFIAHQIRRFPDGVPPERDWDAHDRVMMQQIVSRVADEAERRGTTGLAPMWRYERHRIAAVVDDFLDADNLFRRTHGVHPVVTEWAFGTDDNPSRPPAELTLPDGRSVRFRGFVDRVDVGPDKVVVTDYKTGRRIDDPMRIQLPLYALAWQGPGAVTGQYWYTADPTDQRFQTQEFDEPAKARLVALVSATAEYIEKGVFPARPGAAESWKDSYENCRFCEMDDICERDRGTRWERVRQVPRVTGLAALLDGTDEEPS